MVTAVQAPTGSATLGAWLTYIELIHPREIEMGLDRSRVVAERLGISFSVPVITVGGTNGKGSTCAMLETILLQAGYRVGLYSKPHFLHFNERARCNGEMLGDAELIAAFEEVEAARTAGGEPIELTYYEFTTLAILMGFARAPLDVVVLEVGLGGRLDTVNLIDADCAVITSIDIDHSAWLGTTRNAIGFEKAGIYRTGRPAICGDPAAPQSLVDHAQSIGADLWLMGRDFGYASAEGQQRQQWNYRGRQTRRNSLAYPALRGANQLLNAASALAALEALAERLPVTQQAVRNGLMMVELPGRFQVLPGRPAVVLDVAHNPHAAAALAQNLDNMGFFAYTWAVFGCMRDKDIAAIVGQLGERIDHWLVTDLPVARAASAAELGNAVRAAGLLANAERSLREFDTPQEAWRIALEAAGESDRIVVFGSFHTVAAVMQARDGTVH